ncbi:unnamed protein product [Gemmata massiliana]|uniref:Uncharacterized protein n=1 Tax=Gemmata massiliana TaxID=1210884 RepID=A0A6P2CVV9_9BACT|nr:hypothetical protein [Gemmata massiliana]VTR93278.1 unnamed protein product [Gemmata massiliana]
MRASLLTAAVAAALTFTLGTASDAKAQITVYPSINSSPYVYPVGYTYPSYSYNYAYNYPGYRTYSYGWTNPYSTWQWAGYRTYPTYPTYYGGYTGYYGGPRYYGGWRGRRW